MTPDISIMIHDTFHKASISFVTLTGYFLSGLQSSHHIREISYYQYVPGNSISFVTLTEYCLCQVGKVQIKYVLLKREI